MTNHKCLTCHLRITHQRGCCLACCRRHRLAISRGEVTWDALVKAGKALAARRVGLTYRDSRGRPWRKKDVT